MRCAYSTCSWLTELGEQWDEDLGKILLHSEFDYMKLSKDETIAVFKMESAAEEYQQTVRERLQRCVPGDFEDPQHTIQIHRDVTDGPIPRASFDGKKFQLSCNWRELFTAFYGEIQLSTQLDRDYLKTHQGWAAGLKRKMERGEFDMMSMLQQIMDGFAAGTENNLKRARRARIRRQFKALDIDWNGDSLEFKEIEERSLKALAHKRQLISMAPDSDDESDESSSGEETDEEWEDEDDERSDNGVVD